MPEKKVCPILTALMPLTEAGGKTAFSCLGPSCAWWIRTACQPDPDAGGCAVAYLASIGGNF